MKVKRLWFEGERIYIETEDGRTLWQSILYYDRLLHATDEQRMDYELNAFGIHWEEIDEDVSYESFEYDDPEPVGVAEVFLKHPEINASAVARRLGMSQSLLAQYIRGLKRPSEERSKMILDEVRKIGAELSMVGL